VICDRKILSSDPSDWDELISEAAGAEKYSRRLSERITEGYAAKFDQERDPGGHAALGFRRLPQPPHTLEIDPERMPVVVGLFERYALGNVSATQLEAETGLAATRIRMILMNPLYNGWIRRHRGKSETRRPAPWRATPPVSDELWARVEEIRRAKTRGGGPKNWDRVDLLGGLLVCVCGRQLRNDGTFADGRHRKLPADPCEAWGRKARLGDQTWEAPVLAQKFFDYYQAVFAEGALTEREKALIALAVAHAVQCPYCIDAYTQTCLEKGSDLNEMTEAVHVAVAIRGGASLVHGVQMRNVAEKLSM
jgi:4-carboxymuconolactone decarboxylase